VIKVQGLVKRFGPTVALQDVSFEIGAGEIVGLLGRNGAGKTTTLRVIVGYFPPTEGRVEVAGFDVDENPLEARARIGYLPEHPPLYLDMRVSGYLRFCARLRGMRGKAVEDGLERALVRCGLLEVAGRLIGHLSKGFRQRVGLAQALIHDPDVLVLDEPTAALDPAQIVEIRDVIRDLSKEPRSGGGAQARTVVLSTHRLDDVAATAQRALIISRGRLVADETLRAGAPASDLERRFLEVTRGEIEAA
jgi:ABC-2 type transport system ATP-binding protein